MNIIKGILVKKEREMSDKKLEKILIDTMMYCHMLEDDLQKIKDEIYLTYQWFEERYTGYDLTSIKAYVDKLNERVKSNDKSTAYGLGLENSNDTQF